MKSYLCICVLVVALLTISDGKKNNPKSKPTLDDLLSSPPESVCLNCLVEGKGRYGIECVSDCITPNTKTCAACLISKVPKCLKPCGKEYFGDKLLVLME